MSWRPIQGCSLPSPIRASSPWPNRGEAAPRPRAPRLNTSLLDNETVFLFVALQRIYCWCRWHVLFLRLELILLLPSALTSSVTAVTPLIHFAHHWRPHVSLLLQNSLFHHYDSLSSIYQPRKSVFRTLKVICERMISRFSNRKAPATDTFIVLKASLDLKVVCFFPHF